MRRAIVATAATAAGLVALLGYKSSSTVSSSRVAITPPPSTPSAPTTTAPPPPSSSTPSTSAPSTPQVFTGSDVPYRYGDVQIAITVSGGKVTKIAFPQESATDPRSQSINSQAIPILTQEALAAQSVRIDVVSGATYTSDAFGQAFQTALTKAGK